MKEKKSETLHFRGRPDELETLVPHTFDHARIELRLGEEKAAATHLDLQHERAGKQASFLRFTLPEDTPPGKYSAVVHFNDQAHAATIEVEASPQLLLFPTQISLQVNPGETTPVELTVIGAGNVPIVIPHVHGIGVFEVNGLEDSLSATYRDSTLKGLDRFARMSDELAKRHALVRAVIKEGETTIKPGDSVQLTADLRWPKTMRPGRAYSGTWPIAANLRLSVQVEVSGVREAKEAIE